MLFETERIYGRDFEVEDFDDVHSYASNTDVVKYMIWGTNSEDDTMAFISDVMKCTTDNPRLKYDLAIIDKKLGRLVGGVTIHVKDESFQNYIATIFSAKGSMNVNKNE